MEPEFFSEIEATLWKNLMKLSDKSDASHDYLRGYYCACEDLALIFARLETLSERPAFARATADKST